MGVTRRMWILAIALGVYWAIKLVMLNGALGFVPLSAWLPAMPPWLAPALQLGAPLLIAAAGLQTTSVFAGIARRMRTFPPAARVASPPSTPVEPPRTARCPP